MRALLATALFCVACGSDDSGTTTTTADTGTATTDSSTTDTGSATDTGTASDTNTTSETASETGATTGCSCNDTANSYCSEIVGPAGASLTGACGGMKGGCKVAYADTPCPTAGEIGRCVGMSGALTGSNVFYSTGGMPWTVDKAKGSCSMKETWTPK